MDALRWVNAEGMAAHHAGALAAGVRQANAMVALVDLRNANAAGIPFENRRRVIVAFSELGKPNDTARLFCLVRRACRFRADSTLYAEGAGCVERV
jgi:hypothetical protein